MTIRPPPALDHARQHRVGGAHHAHQVDVDDPLPELLVGVLEEAELVRARVVDEDRRPGRARSSTVATAWRTEWRAVTSMAKASPSISPHTSRAPSRFMSQTATRAPSAASRRHVAAPMPLAPPVTSATCPSSLMGGSLSVTPHHGLRPRSSTLSIEMSLPPGPRRRRRPDVGVDRAPDPVPRALPQPLRRHVHGALPDRADRLHLRPGGDQAGLHRRPGRASRRRGERDPARAAHGAQLGAAARRPRAHAPAQADAALLPRRADAALRRR